MADVEGAMKKRWYRDKPVSVVMPNKTPDIFTNEEGMPSFYDALAVLDQHSTTGEMRKAIATSHALIGKAELCFGCLRPSETYSKEPCVTVQRNRGEL